MKTKELTHPQRAWAASAFTAVEDIVYVGLGLLLAGSFNSAAGCQWDQFCSELNGAVADG